MSNRTPVPFLKGLLAVLVISRCLSEIVNTFAWPSANYVWSCVALAALCLLAAPSLLRLTSGRGNLFWTTCPSGLTWPCWPHGCNSARPIRRSVSSPKSSCGRALFWPWRPAPGPERLAAALRRVVLAMVKCMVLLGIGQIFFYLVSTGDFNPIHLLQARPVRGIFMHPNLYLVTVLPFLFCFLRTAFPRVDCADDRVLLAPGARRSVLCGVMPGHSGMAIAAAGGRLHGATLRPRAE